MIAVCYPGRKRDALSRDDSYSYVGTAQVPAQTQSAHKSAKDPSVSIDLTLTSPSGTHHD